MSIPLLLIQYMLCYLCLYISTISIPKREPVTPPFKEEFKSRLVCPKCNSKFPNFIKEDGKYFNVYYYDLKKCLSLIYNYFPSIKRHFKCPSYNIAIFEELIKMGWNINDEKFGAVDLFFEACATNDIEKVNILLGFGFNIEKYGRDALAFACSYSRFKVYERLISLGTKPDIGIGFLIIKRKKFAMLERILDDGFDVNCKGFRGKSLIHAAAEFGSLKMVKILVERGADFNAKTTIDMTISHYACHSDNSLSLVKYLFESGFDFNSRNVYVETPLLIAISKEKMKLAKYLIEQKAGINICDQEGSSPLHICIERRYGDCVKALIKSGADLDVRNRYGCTPIHLIAEFNPENERAEIIDLLFDHGVNVN